MHTLSIIPVEFYVIRCPFIEELPAIILCLTMWTWIVRRCTCKQRWARHSFYWACDNDNATHNVIDHQDQEKIRKFVKPLCLNGVATAGHIEKRHKAILFWPEIMVTLSRQCCRVPRQKIRQLQQQAFKGSHKFYRNTFIKLLHIVTYSIICMYTRWKRRRKIIDA